MLAVIVALVVVFVFGTMFLGFMAWLEHRRMTPTVTHNTLHLVAGQSVPTLPAAERVTLLPRGRR